MIIAVEDESFHKKNQVSFGGDSDEKITVKPTHSPERDKAVTQILCEAGGPLLDSPEAVSYAPTLDESPSPSQKRVKAFKLQETPSTRSQKEFLIRNIPDSQKKKIKPQQGVVQGGGESAVAEYGLKRVASSIANQSTTSISSNQSRRVLKQKRAMTSKRASGGGAGGEVQAHQQS